MGVPPTGEPLRLLWRRRATICSMRRRTTRHDDTQWQIQTEAPLASILEPSKGLTSPLSRDPRTDAMSHRSGQVRERKRPCASKAWQSPASKRTVYRNRTDAGKPFLQYVLPKENPRFQQHLLEIFTLHLHTGFAGVRVQCARVIIQDMLNLRTVVPIPATPAATRLRHDDRLFLLGSCFSDDVGSRLHDMGHRVTINPLGTLFNPVSLERTISWIASDNRATASDVQWCERQGLHFCFDAGTSLVHDTLGGCTSALNAALDDARPALAESGAIFLTLGSAWAYQLRSSGKVVANCHKQPQDAFVRSLLTAGAVEQHVRGAIRAARRVNPEVRVVLTVSPVRHWREGAVASSRSKAILLTAAHALVESEADTSYFPSFEMMMDELRDYRWYEEDMLHPSATAVDYITERLIAAHFDRTDDPLREEVERLRMAARHRHARPTSNGALRFAEAQLRKARDLHERHPHVCLNEEIVHFQAMLEAGSGMGH